MLIKKILLWIGCCLLCVGCATQKLGERTAAGQSASAQEMGKRYLLGHGVEQDYTQAFYWFKKAAESEDSPFAQNELGYLYAAGRGVQKDYKLSLYWYQKAAEHGLASAQYNLGIMYANGLGTTPNRAEAVQWLKKSLAHGFEPARQALQYYSQ